MEANKSNNMFEVLEVKNKEISDETHAFLMLVDAYRKIYDDMDTLIRSTINPRGLRKESEQLGKTFDVGITIMHQILSQMINKMQEDTGGEYI